MLIVGTCIGGGILALPMSTAPGGFLSSSLLLFGCWLLMTFSAFLILEVNLLLPENSNMISMAKVTTGRFGQVVAWISYVLLLFALLCAYTAGGMDITHSLLSQIWPGIPVKLNALIFLVVFGAIVYFGVKLVDYANRGLLSLKLILFFILIAIILPKDSVSQLPVEHINKLLPAVMVVITSFGFAVIVPTLRTYFNSDVKKLRTAVLIGSLIPLAIYILWDFTVQATQIPTSEFLKMLHSDNAVSMLTAQLVGLLKSPVLDTVARSFTSICIVTSFLGVSLCLADFLSDGLKIEKKGMGKPFIHLLVFLPPFLIVIFNQAIFVKALAYAGVFCVILLMLLPAVMAYSGRYVKKINSQYTVMGGKPLLILTMIMSVVLIWIAIKY